MKTSFKHLLVTLTILMGGAAYSYAQPNVQGRVTDSAGLPLPGVAVLVSGTTNGTMTDDNGNYSISGLKKGDVLIFSSLGLGEQQFDCDGSLSKLNVTMVEDATFLEETIVVGYGVQKKSSMTSAVSAMKGEELLKAPATNVSQLIAGKLSGVSSVQESGEPGLDQASLRIRGSQYGAKYVVDGFPVDNINDIDPYDIESISVLKDGASAAVYGLQAANGIIIITTKKGQAGKPKITYNATFGASMNANFPEFMDGPQFAYYYNVADMMDRLARGDIGTPEEYTPYFTADQVKMMTNGDPTDGWDNVNYIDKVFGTGFTQKHNVTLSGGTDNTKYFASFGYLDQKGNIDNFNYNRYNVRTNIESQFAKYFKFTIGLSGVFSNRQTPGFSSGGSDSGYEAGWLSIPKMAIMIHPYLPVKYNDLYSATLINNTSKPHSPLAAIYESGYKKTRGLDVTANTSLSFDVPGVKGLQLKVSGAFDYGATMNKNLDIPIADGLMAYHQGAWIHVADPRDNTGTGISLGEGTSYYQRMTGQAGITYTNTFGKHFVDLLALGELNDYKSNSHSAYAKLLPFAELPELSFGQPTDGPISGGSSAWRSAGYVFRARYNWDERYLAEFTGRYDGSYKFAGMKNTRWGFFPSASVAWNISKEPWMSGASFLDDLKIRGSVALLGNDLGTSAYMYLKTFSPSSDVIYGPYNSGSTVNPSYSDSGIPNVDLTWEKQLSYNVGFDLSMWNGMLSMEVDAFYNYVFDMLTANGGDYPPSMGGYYKTYINNNAYDVKGVDVMVSHRNHFMLGGKPFQYGVSATVTYAQNRWIKYPDQPNVADCRKVVGTSLDAIYVWVADGLYRSEEEIDNSAWYGTRPCIGDIKYVDLNGDGEIDDVNDKARIGRSNRPKLTYGLNLDFAWNGIDFNAQFTGGALFDISLTGTYHNGNDDNTIWTQTFKEGANSPLFLVENAYSIYNPDGTFPRLTLSNTGHGGDNGLASTFWLRDGKYVRLKSAQLGYTFPRKWTEKIKLDTFRIFVEGQNIFTIDGLPEGIDPESPGVNNGYYPQQRLLMGGVTLTF
ncbi:MAG: TonB-dependent receptor [Bacteroidales bacterium]|nr:TonB-dependent receptor [Bacteroidales bacterium]